MADGRIERRLAAILAADVAGYSRMIANDEQATLRHVRECVSDVLAPLVREHGGRIVKTMGDGVLAEFPSAVEALLCATGFQTAMAARNGAQDPEARIIFRIGVNAGDAVLENGDVFGDVVNVASRIERLSEPGGVCVSARVREDALGRTAINFEDTGEHQLKNIERPVRVYRVRPPSPSKTPLTLPDRPSIAVLPFENMSADKEQDYFVDGVTEDIISALSRWRWFFVIARNSSFIYKGRAVDVTQVGRELGVRYVLEGSVRKHGARVRVAVQLIDASNGAHVWADTFERDLLDLFAMHDEITEHVVNAIEPAMLDSEGARTANRNLGDLSAFDCFQRGMWRLNQVSAESAHEAEALFREAIRRDPALSLAHAGLSRILYGAVVYGWSREAERDLAEAEQAARTAIALDPRDAWAHFALSGALLYIGRHDDALEEAQRTIALNPNFAFGHFRVGQVLIYCGRAADSIAPLERSVRHNPFDPQIGAMRATLSLAHYHAGLYEAAIAHAQDAIHLGDHRATPILAASLARLGRLEEARVVLSAQAQERTVAMASRRLIPYAHFSDFQDLLEGLRLAGLGEDFAARLEELRDED